MTGHEVLYDIPSVEPLGPKGMIDVLVIAPCTGNTLAKLALAHRYNGDHGGPNPICGAAGPW